jgi:hypothetical protein
VPHRVLDFDPWREVHDWLAPLHAAGCLTAEPLHRMVADPGSVLVIHHFGPAADAHGCFSSPDLVDATERAGVKAGPRIQSHDWSDPFVSRDSSCPMSCRI